MKLLGVGSGCVAPILGLRVLHHPLGVQALRQEDLTNEIVTPDPQLEPQKTSLEKNTILTN